MVVNGSLSKTAVNASAGARSQLSGLIVAALTIVTLLVLTGLFEDLPEATLAAIVIAAVIELVDVPALIRLYRAYSSRLGREFGFVARPDFIAAIAALLGVTVFDTLPGPVHRHRGLAAAADLPRLAPVRRDARQDPGPDGHYRDIDRHPDAQRPDHVVVLRVESGLYFANADAVRAQHPAAPQRPTASARSSSTPRRSRSSTSPPPGCSPTRRRARAPGRQLLIARDIGQVRDVLTHVIDDPAFDHVYPTVAAAVDAAGGGRPRPTRRRREIPEPRHGRLRQRAHLIGSAQPVGRR